MLGTQYVLKGLDDQEGIARAVHEAETVLGPWRRYELRIPLGGDPGNPLVIAWYRTEDMDQAERWDRDAAFTPQIILGVAVRRMVS